MGWLGSGRGGGARRLVGASARSSYPGLVLSATVVVVWVVPKSKTCLACMPAPFQLVRDGDPTRVGEVATPLGPCLRSGPCCAYLLPVLCGRACPRVSLCLVAAWCSSWVLVSLKLRRWTAKLPGASEAKCLCAVLLCMATWEAIPNSEEAPCNNFTS